MISTAFVEAASILLREGLEALLVLAAIGAYMTRVGAGDKLHALYVGAAAAVVASLAAAWIFEQFNNGMHNDLVEGFVMLLAAGLMFWVSGWLFLKQDPRAWQSYLKTHTGKIVGGGTIFAVAALAFLAVFREGAETVLFLHALAKTKGGWTSGIVGGLAAASVVLIGLYIVIMRASLKLPLRAMFVVTSAFMFVMGLRFVGAALQEFQEQAWVDVHPAPGSELLETLGFNATWEALGIQAILAIASFFLIGRDRTAHH